MIDYAKRPRPADIEARLYWLSVTVAFLWGLAIGVFL